MLRYWALALLALIPAAAGTTRAGGKAEKDFKFEGKITKDDPRDKVRNLPCKIHTAKLKGGMRYTIDMIGQGFDAYLRLEDGAGKQLAEDDDSGGNQNARIEFACPRDGEYRFICTVYSEGQAGSYTLLIKSAGAAPKTVSTHEVLIGKPAPDFEADFAVNGKAVRLADLKGKVVLVEFWNVTSEPCAATFPRLRALTKAHRAAGLEIVGVTYYPSEIGQNLAFDKGTGKFRQLDNATRDMDRAALREFAAYHKLDHLLLALPKEEALKAFDAYAVNGVPQFVLIDRKGLVQSIRVGEDERTATALEADIKKALAEK